MNAIGIMRVFVEIVYPMGVEGAVAPDQSAYLVIF
jgi:hypothetical protein